MRYVVMIFALGIISESTALADPNADAQVKKVLAAAGGREQLLTRFRMQERFNSGTERKSPGTLRTSVIESPKFWWVGTRERGKEPAKVTTWAWTLGILTHDDSQIAVIPDVTENDMPLAGLRVTGSVDPPLDMYFDKTTQRLVRMDWSNDIYVFGEYREYDGTVYPVKCTMYKRKTRKPWFHHEIIKMERLAELPENLKR